MKDRERDKLVFTYEEIIENMRLEHSGEVDHLSMSVQYVTQQRDDARVEVRELKKERTALRNQIKKLNRQLERKIA